MQPSLNQAKSNRKPSFQFSKKQKAQVSIEQKLKKLQVFYRYRIGSIYRQMKIPIYQKLLQQKKHNSNRFIRTTISKVQPLKANQSIEVLYKFVCLNSKYHHRQKMRFERTPLMKCIGYDFKALQQKLKSKNFGLIYDDLIEDDESDKEQDTKKQYEKDSQFSLTTLSNYKKKNSITGKILIAEGYDDLKARLISKYGWTENEDPTSLIYDLKYLSKKKDIDYVNLLDGQIVNHFVENKSITAKFGLTRNIRNVVSLGQDHNSFFPRCYDVNDVKEIQDFYQDFKFTHAQSILQHYINNNGFSTEDQSKIVDIALKCLQFGNLSIQKKLIYIENGKPIFISEAEWKNLLKYDFTSLKSQKSNRNEDLYKAALQIQNQCQNLDPQYYLNKQNIWIVKPASMSRGRGIKTFNDINQIFDYVIGKQISWVVQKYIERPLIIRKKKFDIRQWVLLTDLKPFRIWIYNECYIRFCADIYKPENLKDRKIHLTNNSVTKGINQIQDGIIQNMMSESQFAQQLMHLQNGKDVFHTVIKPQIQKIAISSLLSVKQNIISRKNTLQVFGYDFMIDQNYKVWLIQVNSSPTMEYSTEITTKIVKKGMTDLADVIQNYMLKGKQYNKEKSENLYGGWRLLTNF